MINVKSCLLIIQSLRFLRCKTYLKLSGCPSIQPHFHFIVSNERSHFKEQESAALPTELTTQNLTKRIIAITKKYVQIIRARKKKRYSAFIIWFFDYKQRKYI